MQDGGWFFIVADSSLVYVSRFGDSSKHMKEREGGEKGMGGGARRETTQGSLVG